MAVPFVELKLPFIQSADKRYIKPRINLPMQQAGLRMGSCHYVPLYSTRHVKCPE